MARQPRGREFGDEISRLAEIVHDTAEQVAIIARDLSAKTEQYKALSGDVGRLAADVSAATRPDYKMWISGVGLLVGVMASIGGFWIRPVSDQAAALSLRMAELDTRQRSLVEKSNVFESRLAVLEAGIEKLIATQAKNVEALHSLDVRFGELSAKHAQLDWTVSAFDEWRQNLADAHAETQRQRDALQDYKISVIRAAANGEAIPD